MLVKTKFLKCIFVSLVYLFALEKVEAQASVHPGLIQIFKQNFYNNFDYYKCGLNILNLIKSASNRGIDLSRSYVITIENKGNSAFGMVNAQYVRNSRGGDPEERNWYHHVVLEVQGAILDFHFSNSPTPMPKRGYIKKMYLDYSNRSTMKVEPNEKLNRYKITIQNAREVVNAVFNNGQDPKELHLTMGEWSKF